MVAVRPRPGLAARWMAAALAACLLAPLTLAGPTRPAFAQERQAPAPQAPPAPRSEQPPAPEPAQPASDEPADTPDEPTPDQPPVERSHQITWKGVMRGARGALHGLASLFAEEPSFLVFILVTLIMGGAAGYSSGKALAQTWRPAWQLAVAALVLAVFARFIHFSLFGASFLTLHYYLVDTLIIFAIAALSFRHTRARQMTQGYDWLFQRSGRFSWRNVEPGAPRHPV